MDQKLSVLLVTTKLYYNGAKKYHIEVANELAARGHKVGLIFDTGPLEGLIDPKVIKYKVRVSNLGFDSISRLKIVLKAAYLARKEEYQVIHSEASSSRISHKLLQFFSRAKVVETIHQVWAKTEARQKAAKILPLRADALISISPGVTTVMKENGMDTSKVVVIQNGINTKEFQKKSKEDAAKLRSSLGISKSDPVLVWVARISREKNPEAFINWFPYILADFPNTRLVMVGDNGIGNREYLNFLIEKIKKLNLSKHIICVGGQTNTKKYLDIGDIFTITGRARDMSVMEAMASGLPVVVSKLGYPYKPELVVHNETGYIFDWNQWKSWAYHIKLLIRDTKKAKRFGQNGKNRINKFFTVQRYCDDLEKVYRRLLYT